MSHARQHAALHAQTRTNERRRSLAHEAARLMAEGGIRDYHQAKVANDQNEVMKRLTAIASILLVPTLIVGVYGQNLTNETYKTDAQEFSVVGGIRTAYFGAPRTWMVKLTARY